MLPLLVQLDDLLRVGIGPVEGLGATGPFGLHLERGAGGEGFGEHPEILDPRKGNHAVSVAFGEECVGARVGV